VYFWQYGTVFWVSN